MELHENMAMYVRTTAEIFSVLSMSRNAWGTNKAERNNSIVQSPTRVITVAVTARKPFPTRRHKPRVDSSKPSVSRKCKGKKVYAAAVMIMLRKGSSASRQKPSHDQKVLLVAAPSGDFIALRHVEMWKSRRGGNKAAAHEDENVPVKAIGLGKYQWRQTIGFERGHCVRRAGAWIATTALTQN